MPAGFEVCTPFMLSTVAPLAVIVPTIFQDFCLASAVVIAGTKVVRFRRTTGACLSGSAVGAVGVAAGQSRAASGLSLLPQAARPRARGRGAAGGPAARDFIVSRPS